MVPNWEQHRSPENGVRAKSSLESVLERKRNRPFRSPSPKKARYSSPLDLVMHPFAAFARLFSRNRGAGTSTEQQEDDNPGPADEVVDLTSDDDSDEIQVIESSQDEKAASTPNGRCVANRTIEIQDDDENDVILIKSVTSSEDVIVLSDSSIDSQRGRHNDALDDNNIFVVSNSTKNDGDDFQVIGELIRRKSPEFSQQRRSIEEVRDEVVGNDDVEDSDRESSSSGQKEGSFVFSNTTSPCPEDSASRSITPAGGNSNRPNGRSRDRWHRPQNASQSPWSRQKRDAMKIQKTPITFKKYSKLSDSPINMMAQRRYSEVLKNMRVYKNSPLVSSKNKLNSAMIFAKIKQAKQVVKGNSSLADSSRSSRVVENGVREHDVVDLTKESSVDDRQEVASPFSETTSIAEDHISEILSRITLANKDTNAYSKISSSFDLSRNRLAYLNEEARIRGAARIFKTEEIEEKVRQKLSLEGIRYVPPAKEKDEFIPLSNDALELCNVVWSNQLKESEVFVEAFGIKIARKDLFTLNGDRWLNDEVINFYLQLICERSTSTAGMPKVYAFNTFFYTSVVTKGYASVKRWTKKVDVFSYDILLVPVHLKIHWCMAVSYLSMRTIKRLEQVIDMAQKEIVYYDSMFGPNQECLDCLNEYLSNESKDKKKVEFNFEGWKTIQKGPKEIPRQMNGSDCGVFACQFAEFASRRRKIAFNQAHMPYYRRRMLYEIVQKRLLS